MTFTPIIGVVQTEKNDNSQSLLADFAQSLLNAGWNVGGLVQQTTHSATGPSIMELVDIRTKERFLISQPLGKDSSSCCLDPSGLCDSSAVLRRELSTDIDLLIVNKFAVAESEGKGLLQELFLAIEQGVPVLTSVASRYKDDWGRLTGGCGQNLPPSIEAMTTWWDRVSATRKTHGAGN